MTLKDLLKKQKYQYIEYRYQFPDGTSSPFGHSCNVDDRLNTINYKEFIDDEVIDYKEMTFEETGNKELTVWFPLEFQKPKKRRKKSGS